MSAAENRTRPVPVGPGRRGAGDEPPFDSDPLAWFQWVDRLLERQPTRITEVGPSGPWDDGAGHRWRVVSTPDGPEVRPGLQNPFLVNGSLPRITAVLLTPEAFRLELALEGWREVRDVRVGDVRAQDIGLAMLTRTELPHLGLERIGPETWALAAARWHDARVGIDPSGAATNR